MNSESTPSSLRVSVVMPVLNGRETIEAAVRSVLSDIGANDELIIVDDRSTDDTRAVLAEVSGQFKVIDNYGSGIVDALNTGLETSRGEFIARCDADDRWLPGHTEHLFDHLRSHTDAVAVFGGAQLCDSAGRPAGASIPPLDATALRKAMLRRNPLVHGTVLARRASIQTVGGYHHVNGAEDFDLWMRLSSLGPLSTVPTIVYEYHLSDSAVHAAKRRRQARSTVVVLLRHARRTRRLSLIGLARNAASAVWLGKRFWYRA